MLFPVFPHIGWRSFLGLGRVSGLRRGEALKLEGDDVDWVNHRLVVVSEKAGKKRVVRIEPLLQKLLLESFAVAKTDKRHVVLWEMVSRSSVCRRFESIIKRAGLPQWSALFQVLRRNRETDLTYVYPQYVVSM